MSAPRVLILHADVDDYLADSLLHGLRSLLGGDAIESPRRDALYDDLSPRRRGELYGRGFTLYTRLPELPLDRDRIEQRLDAGEFDVVVLADVHRNWGPWAELLLPRLERLRAAGTTVVAIDGGDGPAAYPHGPTWWRLRPRPPRALGRVPYFKRELLPLTAQLRYPGLPSPLAERLLARAIRPIAFSIPADRLADGDEPKRRLLATHVVDPEVAARVGAPTSYAFAAEADYYADLRAARYGVTTRKAGWDCLRHYELAASGCVPCFRELERKPPLCAPHGLDATNCLSYRDADDLLEQLEAIGEERYARLRAGALEWARANTTTARARQLLAAVGHPVAERSRPHSS